MGPRFEGGVLDIAPSESERQHGPRFTDGVLPLWDGPKKPESDFTPEQQTYLDSLDEDERRRWERNFRKQGDLPDMPDFSALEQKFNEEQGMGAYEWSIREEAKDSLINKLPPGVAGAVRGAQQYAYKIPEVLGVATGSDEATNQLRAGIDRARDVASVDREDMHWLLSDIDQATAAIGEYGTAAMTPGGVLPYVATTSTRDGYVQGKQAGLNDEEAMKFGLARGTIETAFTYLGNKFLGGGIDSAQKGVLGKVISSSVAKHLPKSMQPLVNVAWQGQAEAIEEIATEAALWATEQEFGVKTEQALGDRLWDTWRVSSIAGSGAEGGRSIINRFSQAVERTKADVEEAAQAIQDAQEYEGDVPPTDRKGFQEATGKSKTSKGYRDVFAESVESRAQESPAQEPESVEPQVETETPAGRPLPDVDIDQGQFAPDIEKRLDFSQDAEPGVRPISPLAVQKTIKSLVQAFGGTGVIRTGIFGPTKKRASGYYHPNTGVSRSRQAYNFPTIYHEAGHAIEDAMYAQLGSKKFSNWEKELGKGSAAHNELIAAGQALYGNKIGQTGADYDGEGFAEFTRFYATKPKEAKQKFPEFSKWFEGNFATSKKQKAALRKTRDAVQRYAKQGAKNRALQHIVDTASPAHKAGQIKEAVEYLWNNSKKLWEGLVPLEKAVNQAKATRKRRGKGDIDLLDDPYQLADAFRMTSSGKVADWVAHGQTDMWGNQVGPALQSIRDILPKGSRSDFIAYLYAMRHLALVPHGVNTGLRDADATSIFNELDSPEFQQAAQVVYDFSENTLDYMASASEVLAEHVQNIRDKYGTSSYYIPLARVFENVDDAYLSAEGGDATSNPLKRLRGSTLRIKDPLQQLVIQTERMVQRAHDMHVFERLLDLTTDGIGEFVEEVPRELIPQHVTSVEKAAQMLNQALKGQDLEVQIMESSSGISGTPGDMLSAADASLPVTFFGKAIIPPGGRPIVPYVHRGELKWFMMSKDMYEMFNGGPQWARAAHALLNKPGIRHVFTTPVKAFRMGATSLNAAFQAVSNPARDLQTYLFNAPADSIRNMLSSYMQMVYGSALDSFSGGRYGPEMAKVFRRLGLHLSQPIREGGDPARRMSHRVTPNEKGLRGAATTVRNAAESTWDWMVDVLQTLEGAPRTAAMKMVADKYGWKEGDDISPEMAVEMMLAGKKTTVDFTAAGDLTGIVRQLIPFYNVMFQAPRSAWRGFKDHPGRYMATGASLTAMTMYLWLQNKDDEWWQEEEGYTKWNYHQLKISADSAAGKALGLENDEVLRIPKDQEAGVLFSSLPLALVESLYRKDPESAMDFAKTLASTHNPIPSPLESPAIKTAWEAGTNYDYFWNKPVVPQGLQYRAPEDQYNEYTSEPAKAAGAATGLSPMHIDHALHNLSGGLANRTMDMMGVGGKVTEVDEPASLPILGRLFKRGGPLGNRPKSIGEVYEARMKLLQRQHDPANNETALERQQRLAVTDATEAISELMSIRADVKDASLRRVITEKAKDIAKWGLAQENSKKPERNSYKGVIAEMRRKAKTPAGGG